MLVVLRPRVRGFTLIEMMTVVVIVAILAAFAVPNFRQFVVNQRVRNASFDLTATLLLARSQAISENRNVSMVQSGSSGSGWMGGWNVTDGTTILQRNMAVSGVSISDSASLSTVTYAPNGRTSTAATRFTVQASPALDGVSPRCVTIALNGMPSAKTGACS